MDPNTPDTGPRARPGAAPPRRANGPWTESHARVEAARCLYCFDAPCSRACPAGVDVPEFIRSLNTGAYRAAARLVLSANALAETCGCVCPVQQLCVGACVLAGIRGQSPIAIHRLQRFVAHWARENVIDVFERGWPTGRRVALIGGGPASLACAYELARLGHQPVVFESRHCVGGLSAGSIAPHKLDPALPAAEASWLARIGIEIRTSITVGREISFATLEREYDVIFLGVGLGPDAPLGIPGEDASPILGAVEFLREVSTGRLTSPLPWQRVLCVGGGNAAIDAVRTLKDLGAAEVLLIRRRGEDEISGYVPEWAAARVAGVAARFRTQAIAVLSREGRVTGLRCVRTVPGPATETARSRVVPLPGSEHEIVGDAIVRAVGRVGPKAILPGLPQEIAFDGRRIAVDPETGATSRPGWFAGGDCANGGANVVNAAADGRRVARAIDRYLARRGREA